jgi:RNA polymerase sigma factor (sigma-70 family)
MHTRPIRLTEQSLPPGGDDERLLAALLRGDDEAWRRFHVRYAGPMRRTIVGVRSRFPSSMSVEDVSDVYAELCLSLLSEDKRRLRQFEPARGIPLRAWLDALARNAAYDFLRNRRRQPYWRLLDDELADTEALVDERSDPFAICCARERIGLVTSMIADLPPRDQEFAALHYYEGLDPAETAERLGICLSTVYSKNHKIRARIGTLLEKRRAA